MPHCSTETKFLLRESATVDASSEKAQGDELLFVWIAFCSQPSFFGKDFDGDLVTSFVKPPSMYELGL